MRGLISGILFLLFGTSVIFALSQFLYALLEHPREIKFEDMVKMMLGNITVFIVGALCVRFLFH